jgi:pSer/pThr/pTyr-binding forkhead associated (FHA) protein
MILKNLSQPQSQPIEMTEFICFGRSQDNHIVLDDAQAADRHARIEKKEDKYLLRDLRTASGTSFNRH